jgi:hypothetical protein
MKIELKNWHDVPVTITTPNETVQLPPSGSAFIFDEKFVVKVSTVDVNAPMPGADTPAQP